MIHPERAELIRHHVGEILREKDNVDEARVVYELAWEDAKETGRIPRKPLAMALKLAAMIPSKREAWMEAFIEDCEALELFTQARFDFMNQAPVSVQKQDDLAAPVQDERKSSLIEEAFLPVEEEEAETEAHDSDDSDDLYDDADAHAAGKRAGLAGVDRIQRNPHNEGSDRASIWDRGWVAGDQERTDLVALGDLDNVRVFPGPSSSQAMAARA